MNPLRRKALPLIVLLLAGSLSVANAQTRPNTENDRNRRMENRDERGNQENERKSPTEKADIRLDRMRASLELTNPQMNELREPLVRYYTAKMALRDRVRDNNTEEVRANARREAQELRMRLDERMKGILTTEQYGKYNTMAEERAAKMKARKADRKDDRKDKKNKMDKKGDRDNSDRDWDDDDVDDDRMERRGMDKK